MVLAADSFDITNPAISPKVGTGNGIDILQLFLGNFLQIMFIAGGVVAFFMLLLGGFEYITAGGDKEKTQNSTKRITAGIVGLAILFSAFAIIKLVGMIFGINILKFEIPVL
ncbi:MAG: hypothetical protein AAB550_00040 [Patescibacteria group bacterium]